MAQEFSKKQAEILWGYQRDEITAHYLYAYLAGRVKDEKNKKVLSEISSDELRHYRVWSHYTGKEGGVRKVSLFFYKILGLIFGYTFALKLMERGEDTSINMYKKLGGVIPEIKKIMDDEEKHEDYLIDLLDEERLNYIGSMVLGLNDALVELTGTIAGLTFAMSNNRLVALSAIITGIAATLSMGASNYLAEKADGHKNAFTSSLFTGGTYLVAVILLVLPYLLFPENLYIPAFITMIVVVVALIAIFNFYISVTKDQNFFKAFGQMAAISFSVMIISYLIGLVAKAFLGVNL